MRIVAVAILSAVAAQCRGEEINPFSHEHFIYCVLTMIRYEQIFHIRNLDVSDDCDSGFGPRTCLVAELAADPEAPRWARDCAWIPGTGHCRNRPCGTACLFRAQRKAEAEHVMRSRRQRRPAQEAFAERMVRRV
jgi:hypothetical protein